MNRFINKKLKLIIDTFKYFNIFIQYIYKQDNFFFNKDKYKIII